MVAQVEERVDHWQIRNVHSLPEASKGRGSSLPINGGRKARPGIYWRGKSAEVGGDLPCRSTGFSWLYYVPIAAVTNYHKPDGVKTPIYYLNNVGTRKSEMGLMELKSKTVFLLGFSGEICFQAFASSWRPSTFLGLWPHHSSPCFHSRHLLWLWLSCLPLLRDFVIIIGPSV